MVVNVTEVSERDTNDLLRCSHNALQRLPAGCSAGSVPHSDTAGQDALNGSCVEGLYDGVRNLSPLQFAEEVQAYFKHQSSNSAVIPECENDLVGDIVFLVDSSGSIGSENFDLIKEFLKSIIKGLDIGPQKIRVGLAQYSRKFHPEFGLKDNEDKESLLNKVNQMYYRKGKTWTGEALDSIRTRYFTELEGSRAGERVPQIAVLITDGGSSDNVEEPAWRLRNHGVLVFCIGVEMKNQTKLETIASPPHHHNILPIKRFQDLQRVNDLCILLHFETQSASQTLTFTHCWPLHCTSSADDFPFLLVFLDFIINSLEIGQAKVRVGIVTASHVPRVEAHLNTFHGKAELEHFISLLPPRQGGAKIGAALNSTREVMFRERNRGRRNARKVAIVITDTKSQDSVSEAASSLRRAGTTVYAVGVKDAERTELEEMASHPSSRHVFPRADFSSLVAETQTLLRSLCSGIAESSSFNDLF
uniref:VWFA domain-containing protein n=1 Tax=Oryzias melastigma TaxID=30732 RepID=A0A3B3D215_ORYME